MFLNWLNLKNYLKEIEMKTIRHDFNFISRKKTKSIEINKIQARTRTNTCPSCISEFSVKPLSEYASDCDTLQDLIDELLSSIENKRPVDKSRIINLRIPGYTSLREIQSKLNTQENIFISLSLCNLCMLGFSDKIS